MQLNIEIEVQGCESSDINVTNQCETLTLEIIDAPTGGGVSIDDAAGLGDTDVTWSADKSSRELADKVDKVAGLGLSELSFTTDDKNSLDQSEQDRHTHANKSVIDDLSDNEGALEYRGLPVSDQAALDAKVDKVAGKSLVDDDEIAKLATVQENATANRSDSQNADKIHGHTTDQVDGLDAALLSKFDKADIVQTAGTATDKVMSQKAVTDITDKTIKGVVGKNLFNPARVIRGFFLSDSGQVLASAGRGVSEKIKVQSGSAYTFSGSVHKVAVYNSDGVFVSLLAKGSPIPAAGSYALVDITLTGIDSVQFEMGITSTAYETFRIELTDSSVGGRMLKQNSVYDEKIAVSAVTSRVVKPHSLTASALSDAEYLNIFDGEWISGKLNPSTGVGEQVDPQYMHTGFLSVRNSTQYATSSISRGFFYDKNQNPIYPYTTNFVFTTPQDCAFMRFNVFEAMTSRFQFNRGSAINGSGNIPEPHNYKLNGLVIDPSSVNIKPQRFLSFSDAWIEWRSGSKFPLAFLGDSTTEGNGTYPTDSRNAQTGGVFGVDYIRENAYCAVLERLIRSATSSTTARIYNAGFSGRNSVWALSNINDIFSGDLSDTKMIGISMGINDRTANPKLYATNFRRDILGIVNWCYEKGIQPFLLTTQPTAMPFFAGSAPGPDIEMVANNIKRDIAKEWGLEIIDINKYGREFQSHSSYPMLSTGGGGIDGHAGIYEPVNNTIHWANAGHKYEAELIFASMCPNVIWTDKPEILDFANQQLESTVQYNETEQIIPFINGFKIKTTSPNAGSVDRLLQRFYVFSTYRGRYVATAHTAGSVASAYAKIDGVTTAIDDNIKQLTQPLDMGLHVIEAWTGTDVNVSWCGFKLNYE